MKSMEKTMDKCADYIEEESVKVNACIRAWRNFKMIFTKDESDAFVFGLITGLSLDGYKYMITQLTGEEIYEVINIINLKSKKLF